LRNVEGVDALVIKIRKEEEKKRDRGKTFFAWGE